MPACILQAIDEQTSSTIHPEQHTTATTLQDFQNVLDRHRATWPTQIAMLAQRGDPSDTLIVKYLTERVEQLFLSQEKLIQNLLATKDHTFEQSVLPPHPHGHAHAHQDANAWFGDNPFQ